jgi:hypothetical protein
VRQLTFHKTFSRAGLVEHNQEKNTKGAVIIGDNQPGRDRIIFDVAVDE